MDGTRDGAQHRLTSRALLLLMLIGIGLSGAMLGSWFGGGRLAAMAVAPVRGAEVLLPLGLLIVLTAAAFYFKAQPAARDAAIRDPLTGLHTRAYADDMVEGLIARDERAGASALAMMMLRPDALDEIQRRYGTAGVERVMALVGSQIRGQTRGGDLASSDDGSVFVVYLHCDSIEQALAFGRRIAMLLSAQQLDLQGDVIKITLGIGASMRDCGEPLAPFRARVAEKLVAAQRAGRSEVVV